MANEQIFKRQLREAKLPLRAEAERRKNVPAGIEGEVGEVEPPFLQRLLRVCLGFFRFSLTPVTTLLNALRSNNSLQEKAWKILEVLFTQPFAKAMWTVVFYVGIIVLIVLALALILAVQVYCTSGFKEAWECFSFTWGLTGFKALFEILKALLMPSQGISPSPSV